MKHITDESVFFQDLFDSLESHMGKDTGLLLTEYDETGESCVRESRNAGVTARAEGLLPPDEQGAPCDYRNAFAHPESGHILRSSGMVIRDHETNRVIGELSIHQDITRAVEAERFLRDYNMYRICTGGVYTADISCALDDLIQEALIAVGTPVSEMKREDKIRFVRYLDDRGVFLITKSGARICNLLGISKFTLYNYLGRVNTGGAQN